MYIVHRNDPVYTIVLGLGEAKECKVYILLTSFTLLFKGCVNLRSVHSAETLVLYSVKAR